MIDTLIDSLGIDVLGILFPVRADKLGKIRGIHTCLLLHRIRTGEVRAVIEVPESGVIHTKQWIGERWRTKHVRVNWLGLTYKEVHS
jgi:hypothetical protein